MISPSIVYRLPRRQLDAAALCTAVRKILTKGVAGTTLVVDLQQVSDIDAAGLVAIYTSAHAAAMAGMSFVVEGVTPELRAGLERKGLARAGQAICEAGRLGPPDVQRRSPHQQEPVTSLPQPSPRPGPANNAAARVDAVAPIRRGAPYPQPDPCPSP